MVRSGICRGALRAAFLAITAGALLSANHSLGKADVPYAWDISVYDRLLATLTPDQEIVRFGDVGITPAQLRTFRERLVRLQEAATNGVAPEPEVVTPAGTTFKWPSGNVYYRFDASQVMAGTITTLKMTQFRDGIAEWAAFANLHFIEFTGTPPTNYITVQQNSTGTEGGYSSSVGMAGGEQFVQFGNGSWNRGTVCHEVGHALGLWHEQQRPDRDTYVMIHPENLADPNDGNFSIVAGGQTFGTTYDFYSVMHYKRTDLSNNGGDTITMRAGYTQYIDVIGKVYDRILSKQDRAGMGAIYPPSPVVNAVVTNTNDSGSGSLRTAIYYAFDRSTDAVPTPTTITFNIPITDTNYDSGTGTFHIKPTYYEVALGNGTTIDGSSQIAGTNTNGPKIVLDGSNFTALGQAPFFLFSPGLILRAANCTVKGLTITGFNERGIDMLQGADPNGSATTGNVIGGLTNSARNIISGNATYGIGIRGATTTGNVIAGNFIGTDQTGASVQGAQNEGVVIYQSAHGNTIGGTVNGPGLISGNLISGHAHHAVFIGDTPVAILPTPVSNLVQGNFIGTNATGTAAIPNQTGVEISNGPQSNVIGGTIASARNVISGNQFQAILIDGAGTTQNLVQGNYLGTTANGLSRLQNNSAGISIFSGAQSNTIGGVVPGARNVISGNLYQNIGIDGATTSSNLVQGNFIGLDASGLTALPSGSSGVDIFNAAHDNVVGGTQPGARNFIAGNLYYGVSISGVGTTANLVQGNSIGVSVAGAVVGNGNQGVAIFPPCCPLATPGPQGNTVGGSAPGASNVIWGNFQGIAEFDATTMKNTFSRNSINGNTYEGIALNDGSNNAQTYPTLSSAVLGPAGNISGTDVGGNYSGSAATIEFFASPVADSSGFGEGQNFIGSLGVAGSGSFTAHLLAAVPAGNVVTATATDSLGNTSQFSGAFTVTSSDNGSDGLPDAWMMFYFGHTDPRSNDGSRATDDNDGDGFTNLQEFLAGTSPINAAQRFRITSIGRSSSDVTVTFASVVGKTYRIESKDDLSQATWTLVQDQILASTTNTAITNPGATALPHRFYRVALEP